MEPRTENQGNQQDRQNSPTRNSSNSVPEKAANPQQDNPDRFGNPDQPTYRPPESQPEPRPPEPVFDTNVRSNQPDTNTTNSPT